MKRLLALLLTLVPVLSYAQFSIDGESLVWKKVYDGATTADCVVYNLQASGLFRDIQASKNLVTAEMHDLTMRFKDLGYKGMNLPIYIANDTFSAFVSVQIKDSKYRVTVRRIVTHNSRLGSGPLENLAVKDGAFDPKFPDPAAIIIEHTFDCIFGELDKNLLDDEW